MEQGKNHLVQGSHSFSLQYYFSKGRSLNSREIVGLIVAIWEDKECSEATGQQRARAVYKLQHGAVMGHSPLSQGGWTLYPKPADLIPSSQTRLIGPKMPILPCWWHSCRCVRGSCAALQPSSAAGTLFPALSLNNRGVSHPQEGESHEQVGWWGILLMPPAPSSCAAQLMGQNGFVSFPQGGNVLFQGGLELLQQ